MHEFLPNDEYINRMLMNRYSIRMFILTNTSLDTYNDDTSPEINS